MTTLETLHPDRRAIIRRCIGSYERLIYSSNKDKGWQKKVSKIWDKCETLEEVKAVANGVLKKYSHSPNPTQLSLLESATVSGRWRACLDLLEHGADCTLPFSNQRYLWSSLSKATDLLGWSSFKKEIRTEPNSEELKTFLLFLRKVAPHTPETTQGGEWGSVQNIVMLRNPFIFKPALEILKQAGHNLDVQDSVGETGFLLACWQADPELIRWFAEQGVDIHAKTRGGWDAWAMMTRSSTLISKSDPEFATRLFEALNVLKDILPYDPDAFGKTMEKHIHRIEDRILFEKWQWTQNLPQASNTSGKSIRL